MRRKNILLLLLCGTLFSEISAQLVSGKKYSVLWKIEGSKNSGNSSYLFGTSHSIYPFLLKDSIGYWIDTMLNSTTTYITENIISADTAVERKFISRLKNAFIPPRKLWVENTDRVWKFYKEKLNWSDERLLLLADTTQNQVLLLSQMQSELYAFYFRKAAILLSIGPNSMDNLFLIEALQRKKKLVGLDEADELISLYNTGSLNKMIAADIHSVVKELTDHELQKRALDASVLNDMSRGSLLI